MRYAWLNALKTPVPDTLARPLDVAEFEARQVTDGVRFAVEPGLGEGYILRKTGDGFAITGGETGVLYGAYALVRALRTGAPLPEGEQKPFYPLRGCRCWDCCSC